MGNRWILGVVLLIIIPIFGILSCRYLYTTQLPQGQLARQGAQALIDNRPQAAERITVSLLDSWKAREPLVFALSPHGTPQQVQEAFSRLCIQLAAQEYPHAAESLQLLSLLFFSLATEQLPSWWSFF